FPSQAPLPLKLLSRFSPGTRPSKKQRACLLPPDDGPCRAMVSRWYYNRYTQSCQEFTYGGCLGNANNFLTSDDCEKRCWTIKKVPKICRMEADGGPCRSYFKRYAFNLSSMRCEEFVYGGCYGNDNNFKDLQSCVDHCLPEKTGPLLCYSPKDEGLCSSSVTRYYYDTKSKTCKEFKYSGCGGNANNFVTATDCYNVCRKGKFCLFVCLLSFFFSFLFFPSSQKQSSNPKYQNCCSEWALLMLAFYKCSFIYLLV
uniref:Tissue factor pathway inhibitor 2 n=1 Tax=Nothoprocta perdicaria TaxID=30464 RepID=A0A8C7E7U9_NOTPE